MWITDLRIRWMWHIESPFKFFSEYLDLESKIFSLNVIILEEKYNSFPEEDRKNIEKLKNIWVKIKNIFIKSPDNPAKLLKAKIISYER